VVKATEDGKWFVKDIYKIADKYGVDKIDLI
jgi:hypothetical protein